MAVHEIPLERRTLHGHFSRDLEPVLTIDSGRHDRVLARLDAGWRSTPGDEVRAARTRSSTAGHALIGPIEVRGARAGQTLEVAIDRVRFGAWGCDAAPAGSSRR